MAESTSEQPQVYVLVVTFDRTSELLKVNPHKLDVQPGLATLYFALQTEGEGETTDATFYAIYRNGESTNWGVPVDGSAQLWRAMVPDLLTPGEEAETINYTIEVSYGSVTHQFDPTVVLQPPPVMS
jgi:hypothetical protein